jgi:peptidoglycan/LPS O-acetylase OafA/YrhL
LLGVRMATVNKRPRAYPSLVTRLSTAHCVYLSRKYFPLLDGLRCLSIIAVVWHHSASGPGILSRGFEGVSLFFVISGYLITTILLRERSSTGRISLRRFYLRRSLRIFPLYYTTLVVFIVLVFLFERRSDAGLQFWHNLPYFLTYTSNWFLPFDPDNRAIFFFAWSLATEEQFYFFWPWIVKGSIRPYLPIATMIGLVMLHYGNALDVGHDIITSQWFLTRVLECLSPPICLGALAALLLHRPSTFRWSARWLGWRWSATAALVAIIAALIFPSQVLLYVAMTWLVIACVLRPSRQPLGQFLMYPLVKYVGIVSYGIYMLHVLCINLVRHLLHLGAGPVLFVVGLAVSVAVAGISYHFFESPLLSLKDKLARRPEPYELKRAPEVTSNV